MHSYRGPRHYSYECKVQLQERPYNARPSRTQQLLNPKLVPKLTNDTPDDATRKKGVADEELARKEAERARKRELDEDNEPRGREHESKRQRSSSVDSVSSISTRSSKSPPPRARASPAPRRAHDDSPPARRARRSRSFDSAGIKDRLILANIPIPAGGLVTAPLRETHDHTCGKRVALLFPTTEDHRLGDSRGTIRVRRVDKTPEIDVEQRKVSTGSTGNDTRALGVVRDIEPLQSLSHLGSAV
ncbi:hypothetical protein J7T55_014679 [Diaporthe amygdali]|uniref:uncharacterized protein n=1 Tax=Phomopsis amygdali TaxID=1214568 RepID=UPI0022FE2262|nr:uncharacterized protein J7T55_014679 [Diaporthe amygdali]KAJ0107149.1 hypothetical protein J7T55_014679 [Diaporthe amygdali]